MNSTVEEGLITDHIFKLVAQLNPSQRIALAHAIINNHNIAALGAQIAIDKFPEVEVPLILEIVKATIDAITPPDYP